MSAPKQIYVEFNMKLKTFMFLSTMPDRLDVDSLYFGIDEDTPVWKVMDFLVEL